MHGLILKKVCALCYEHIREWFVKNKIGSNMYLIYVPRIEGLVMYNAHIIFTNLCKITSYAGKNSLYIIMLCIKLDILQIHLNFYDYFPNGKHVLFYWCLQDHGTYMYVYFITEKYVPNWDSYIQPCLKDKI